MRNWTLAAARRFVRDSGSRRWTTRSLFPTFSACILPFSVFRGRWARSAIATDDTTTFCRDFFILLSQHVVRHSVTPRPATFDTIAADKRHDGPLHDCNLRLFGTLFVTRRMPRPAVCTNVKKYCLALLIISDFFAFRPWPGPVRVGYEGFYCT